MNILERIKNLLRGIVAPQRPDLLAELRRRGALIGEDVHVYSPSTTTIDATCAYLLTIGNHVRITSGVRILNHDYAWAAMKTYSSPQVQPGVILGGQGPVEIGSYVYIGMNAIITRGVKVGDHVIIGAGSVVTKDCESNAVYAGNPARKICTMEEYIHRRKAQQFPEAREIALRYRERMGKIPPMEIFDNYFQLFATREEAEKNPVFRAQMLRMDSLAETQAYMDANLPMFSSYEAFLDACYAPAHPAE